MARSRSGGVKTSTVRRCQAAGRLAIGARRRTSRRMTRATSTFISGYAVLSLTADDATGPAGAMPGDTAGMAGNGGSSGRGRCWRRGRNGRRLRSGRGRAARTVWPARPELAAPLGRAAPPGRRRHGNGVARAPRAARGTAGTVISSGGMGVATGGSAGATNPTGAVGGQPAGAPSAGGTSSAAGSTGGADPDHGGAKGGSQAADGCGCRQAGSQRPAPARYLVGVTLLAALFGAARRKRRVVVARAPRA